MVTDADERLSPGSKRAGEPRRLYAASRLIGYLRPTHFDWPRFHFEFEPTEAFAEVRPLFERQASVGALLHDEATREAAMGQLEEVEAAMNALDLSLVTAKGQTERLTTILIEGDRACLRYGFMRSAQRARRHSQWIAIGEGKGPGVCSDPACDEFRVSFSIFCGRHHYRMMYGEAYEADAT